jgi:RHS repeat-associated protein
VSVTQDGVEVASFEYDALGRRIRKLASSQDLRFSYDGEDIVREFEDKGLSRHFIHGPGIDEPLAVHNGDGTGWYYHADALGSIAGATDYDGITLARRYDAFGAPEAGASDPGHAFTGREWDIETGLYYYRARYYDPRLGRFISEDPLSARQRGIRELNPYPYVANDPANRVDPTGLQSAYWRCLREQVLCAGKATACRMRSTAPFDPSDPSTLIPKDETGQPISGWQSSARFKLCFMGTEECQAMLEDCGTLVLWPENLLCRRLEGSPKK